MSIGALKENLLLVLPLAFVCGLACVMMMLSINVELLDQDEDIYALVAIDLLSGRMPFQGVFDHKPIGVYYLYAAMFSIFGESFVSIRLMTISLLMGTAICIYLGLSALNFSKKSKLAAVATVLAFPIGLSGLAGNTEVMQSFFLSTIFLTISILKIGSLKKSWLLLVLYGLMVALGFSVNYLFSLLGLFSYIAYTFFVLMFEKVGFRQFFLDSFLIFIGFLLGMVLIYSPYLYDYVIGGNLLQSYLVDQGIFLSGYRYDISKTRIIERVFVWIIPFLPIIIAGSFISREEKSSRWMVMLFACATLLSALVAACMSLSLFHHYWILATVPLALIAALSIDKRGSNRVSNRVVGLSLSAGLFLYMISGSEMIVNHYLNNSEGREFHNALGFLEENIGAGEPVAVIGASPVYPYLGKMKIDQKYVFPNHVSKLHAKGVIDGDAYYLDTLSNNKRYALMSPTICDSERYTDTCMFLFENFQEIGSFTGYHPFVVYKRISK